MSTQLIMENKWIEVLDITRSGTIFWLINELIHDQSENCCWMSLIWKIQQEPFFSLISICTHLSNTYSNYLFQNKLDIRNQFDTSKKFPYILHGMSCGEMCIFDVNMSVQWMYKTTLYSVMYSKKMKKFTKNNKDLAFYPK